MKQSQNTPRCVRNVFFAALGTVLVVLPLITACQKPAPDGNIPVQGREAISSSQRDKFRPTLALSLTVLQEQAEKQRQALPAQLSHLGEINRIQGFLVEPDGEIILFGEHDPAVSLIHLDDVVVSLRNAYQVPAYQGVLGCTIAPRPGVNDPWRIQEVKIFGMPRVAMAARHVFLDYSLKKQAAGVLAAEDGAPSLYEMARLAAPLCTGSSGAEEKVEATHRFWFYPLYPPPPRFLQDEDVVLIMKPIEVQLLTEQEFLDRTGQRKGSAPASPLAEHFARYVTQMLATNQGSYAQLRQDFRVIELGQLLHFTRVPAESLRYFLRDYPVAEVEIPALVGGIRREERGEIVCENQITERRSPQGKLISSMEQVKRYHFTSRGGIEAKVDLAPEHFAEEHAGTLAELRRRVRASRPSARAVLWNIVG